MLTYLAQGFFSPSQPQQFSAAVLDGALDSASMLCRAGICADAIFALQGLLQRQGLDLFADDTLGRNYPSRRLMVLDHIKDCTDGSIALQSFIMDGLESAVDARTLTALSEHLGHIGTLMETLHASRRVRRSELRKDEGQDCVAQPGQQGRPSVARS